MEQIKVWKQLNVVSQHRTLDRAESYLLMAAAAVILLGFACLVKTWRD